MGDCGLFVKKRFFCFLSFFLFLLLNHKGLCPLKLRITHSLKNQEFSRT